MQYMDAGLGREDAIHASPTSYYFTVLIDGTLQGLGYWV